MRRRAAVASIMTAVGLVLGSAVVAAPAQAITPTPGPASCSVQIAVASQTTGATWHRTSMAQNWYKGIKANSGATSYTGYTYLG